MSNKFFCDICEKEIDISGAGGTYDRITPNVNHFKDPQNNPPVITVHKDFCGDCCLSIDKAIDSKRTEVARDRAKK